METDAYIALGSNLGDRELNLLRAVAELGKVTGCRVTALSRFYETSPVGMPQDTPTFYNGVVRVTTSLSAQGLMEQLQRIGDVPLFEIIALEGGERAGQLFFRGGTVPDHDYVVHRRD